MTITPVTIPSAVQQPRGPDTIGKPHGSTFVTLLEFLGNENELHAAQTESPTVTKGRHPAAHDDHPDATKRRKTSMPESVLPFGVPLIIAAIPTQRGDAKTAVLPRVSATNAGSSGLALSGSATAQETLDAGSVSPFDVATKEVSLRATSAAEIATDGAAPSTKGDVRADTVNAIKAAAPIVVSTTVPPVVFNGSASTLPITHPTTTAGDLMGMRNTDMSTTKAMGAAATVGGAATVATSRRDQRSIAASALSSASGPLIAGERVGIDGGVATTAGEPSHPAVVTVTQTIIAQAALLGNGQTTEMRLRLHPPALGHVSVVMRRDALGALSAHLVPATREASDVLNANLHHLRVALAQHSDGHGASVSVGQHDTGGNNQARREHGTFAASRGDNQPTAIAQAESSVPRIARTTITTTTIDYDA